jgi:integrase
MKLTDRIARDQQLPRGVADKVWFDEDLGGFGLRIRDGGARSWLVQYDFAGRSHKMTLGSIGTLSAAKARTTAKDVLAKVRLGQNPAAEKRALWRRFEDVETLGALLPRYLTHKRAELKPRSYEEVERHLLTHCAPLHRRRIGDIDQRSVAILLGNLVEKSGPRAGNNTRASGSGFFSWAVREGIADANPFANTNKAPQGDPRERMPDDDELREIWLACPESDYGDIVRLLMLTGARREEIGSLRWSEIDLDEALITLPAVRTKGRRAHEILLNAPALAILKALSREPERDFVFGRGVGGFSGWSRAKHDLDERIAAARQTTAKKGKPVLMPDWTLHDFRRSVSTTLHERLGIPPHVVEDVLGHSTFRQGVASVYNRSSYRAEKRRALDWWAAHLMAVIEGRDSRVVPLRGA